MLTNVALATNLSVSFPNRNNTGALTILELISLHRRRPLLLENPRDRRFWRNLSQQQLQVVENIPFWGALGEATLSRSDVAAWLESVSCRKGEWDVKEIALLYLAADFLGCKAAKERISRLGVGHKDWERALEWAASTEFVSCIRRLSRGSDSGL